MSLTVTMAVPSSSVKDHKVTEKASPPSLRGGWMTGRCDHPWQGLAMLPEANGWPKEHLAWQDT